MKVRFNKHQNIHTMKFKILLFAVALIQLFQVSCATAQKTTSKQSATSKPTTTAQTTAATAPAASMLSPEKIQSALDEAYMKFKDVKEGKNADYIKELANVDPNIFGIALVTADGKVYTKGDVTSMVSVQSISKAFVMAEVIEKQGHQAVQDKIGVDATGMRFNSIVAVELQKGKKLTR